MDLFKKNTNRFVYTDDANIWLPKNKNIGAIITSLPDMEEINATKEDWELWIDKTCENIINSLSDKSVCFFYQTDRKHKGNFIDKKYLISRTFYKYGFKLIMSKIVLKQAPETISLFRPGFTNLFGFSKYYCSGKPTPDVINIGKMVYKNAMGFNACKVAIDFIIDKKISDTVVDPFCGMGSVLKIANDLELNSVGVDIDFKQTDLAKKL